MKDSSRYIRVVEWSEEDQCYVGSSPGLFFGGCHGDDEQAVYSELRQIIEETVADIRLSGRHLPPDTTGL